MVARRVMNGTRVINVITRENRVTPVEQRVNW